MYVENAGDFISTEHFQYALNDWLWRHMTVPGVDSSNTTRFAMYFLYYFYVSLAAATVVTVHVPLTEHRCVSSKFYGGVARRLIYAALQAVLILAGDPLLYFILVY